MKKLCRIVIRRKRKAFRRGLLQQRKRKFIKFSLHKAIDLLAGEWPRKVMLLQQARDQISEVFRSEYVLEVLQRLDSEVVSVETKSVSDFSVFCPVCGIEQNLYDIAEGRCMICGTDLTAEKKELMKVLLAQDIFFDCDENGHIIVPESVVKTEAPAANPEDPDCKT